MFAFLSAIATRKKENISFAQKHENTQESNSYEKVILSGPQVNLSSMTP